MIRPRAATLMTPAAIIAACLALATGGASDRREVPVGSGERQGAARSRVVPALAAMTPTTAKAFPGGVPVVLGLAPGADLWTAATLLSGEGAAISWFDLAAEIHQIGMRIPADQLDHVLAVVDGLDSLVWADLQPPVRLRNSSSVWRCQSGEADLTPIFEHGLRGLPAINDDRGTAVSQWHRKVLAVDFYWELDWPDPDEDSWDDHGHGTHVAGSAAGDADADGEHSGFDGMAPAARLVIQDGGAEFNDCADLPGLGCPLRPLEPVLQQPYDQGARIHSNSWGDEEEYRPFNRYTERTADVDRFMWSHRDFLVFFAAGNAGPGDDTVASPATGKNVVAVGATVRGNNEPPCVVSFSSRGWTHDGRIKPDVVVPGTSILSAHSDRGIDTGNCDPTIMSGTSMATPTAAGLAALVRQYFTDGFYPGGSADSGSAFIPSAALVKAMLIASAVDLTTLGCAGIDPIPSRDQGWGMVQLDRALHFEGEPGGLVVDDHRAGFQTVADAPVRRTVFVAEQTDLKVVLVWTDPPSSSLAEVNLVNDLDLTVSGYDGIYRGNYMGGGVSFAGGEPDRINNVEVVWLPDVTPGWWTVEVTPHDIAVADQDFALVIVGDVDVHRGRFRRGGQRARSTD